MWDRDGLRVLLDGVESVVGIHTASVGAVKGAAMLASVAATASTARGLDVFSGELG